jgi:hypothetical protein
MYLKVIKFNTSNHGICANILFALEALSRRKKKELIYFKFNNLLYSNKFNLWDKFFIQPFIEYEDIIKKKIEAKNFIEEYFKLSKDFPLNWVGKNIKILHNYKIIEPLRKEYKKNIIFNEDINKKFLKLKFKYLKKKTLGVHLRGTDRFNDGHHFNGQRNKFNFFSNIKPIINKKMSKLRINKIFLATDDRDYLIEMQTSFKKNKIILNSTIFGDKNKKGIHASNIYESEKYKSKLGEEALLDAMLMSNCNYSLLSQSNLSIVTLLLRNDYNYSFLDKHMQSLE